MLLIKLRIRLCTALVLIQALSHGAAAQNISKYAGEFLAIGVGARPQSLGAAFVALADDGTAIYWNPAGTGQLLYPQISLMHAEQFAGELNYDFASIILPFHQKTTFGFSMIRLGIDGIPDTRNALIDSVQANGKIDEGERLNIGKISFFSNSDYAFYFNFAHQKNPATFFGANIKLIRRTIGDDTAWGVGFDAGLLYWIGERLSLGVNLMDATTTVIAWDTGRKELILPTLKIGSAYRFTTGAFPVTAIPVIDADARFENREFAAQYHLGSLSIDMHYGLELQYRNISSLRIGYDDIDRISFGTGIHLNRLQVDYAFTSFDEFNELGNSHRISLAFDFTSKRFNRN